MLSSSALARSTISRNFSSAVTTRNWGVEHYGGFNAVEFQPLACARFRGNEGGQFVTNFGLQLAPVSGHLRSTANAQVIQVYVPYEAIHKMDNPDDEYSGLTEAIRRRFVAGEDGIGLEPENVISRACYAHGKQTGTGINVQKSIRLAYNCAVNHIRQTLYTDADLLDKDDNSIVKATLGASILQRFDGALDPEPLADGAINLTGKLPIMGIHGRAADPGANYSSVGGGLVDANGDPSDVSSSSATHMDRNFDQIFIDRDPDTGVVAMSADLSAAGEITLRDLMRSRIQESAIRGFAKVVQDDPVHGEDAVARALIGLRMDVSDVPQVLFNQTYQMTAKTHQPMDAAGVNSISGHFSLNDSFGVVVPTTELGGQLITIAVVRPLERLSRQPDPAQTEVWSTINIVQEQMELDPVVVTRAELESDVAVTDMETDSFYVGHNRLAHDYHASGANKSAQNSYAETQSSMWQFNIPVGVTPQNINYPDDLGPNFMYPFAFWDGFEVEYYIDQRAKIATTLPLGPSPIERLQLFADQPDLIEEVE